jgi:hypothetical protein
MALPPNEYVSDIWRKGIFSAFSSPTLLDLHIDER